MVYRWMFGGCLHKRMLDITTITGYVKALNQVQLDLMEKIKTLGITHFGGLGDWYDRGYNADISAALADTDMDRDMVRLLNGNFYEVIGNHLRIKMDSNPELFLIQPHSQYVTRRGTHRTEQLFRTVDSIMCNGVEIIFMHYNHFAKDALDYKPILNPNAHFHVALFHTESVIPRTYLDEMRMYNMSDDNKIAQCLEGVNLAIVGHIHKPIGTFTINLPNNKTVTMIIPGSLTNTDAGLESRHDSVVLPILEISEDGVPSLSFVNQSLHLELLTFHEKEDRNKRDKLRTLNGNTKEALYETLEKASFLGEAADFKTLSMFLRDMQYTQNDIAMFNNIRKNPSDIMSLVELYKKEESLE